MWWMSSSSACSAAPRRSRVARSTGPRSRSNGRAASSPASRRVAAARAAAGRPARSTRGSASGAGRRDHLRRARPSRSPEGGAQRLVAPHDLAQRRRQGGDREVPLAGAGRGGCCRRSARASAGRSARAAPGRRRAAAPRRRGTGRMGGATAPRSPAASGRLHLRRPRPARVGAWKSVRTGTSIAERLAQAGGHLGGEERVAAQREEVGGRGRRAAGRAARTRSPRPAPRWASAAARVRRLREPPAPAPAGGRGRACRARSAAAASRITKADGHHVGGQAGGQELPQERRAAGASGLRHAVGDQPLLAAWGSPSATTAASRTARMARRAGPRSRRARRGSRGS